MCAIHGGKSLRGPEHPNWKGGRRSSLVNYLPERLIPRYKELEGDEDLLSIREEVVLVDVRLRDVLGRVDSGESGALWQEIKECWADYQKAKWDGQPHKVFAQEEKLKGLIERGLADRAAWDEVRSLADQKARLARAEQQRLKELEAMVPVDRALVFMQGVVNSVTAHAPRDASGELTPESRRMLAGVYADIKRLLNPQALPQGPAAGT